MVATEEFATSTESRVTADSRRDNGLPVHERDNKILVEKAQSNNGQSPIVYKVIFIHSIVHSVVADIAPLFSLSLRRPACPVKTDKKSVQNTEIVQAR